MRRPLAIDLYCGAGGVSLGLFRAGFDVIGVDIAEQANYVFPLSFRRDDALDYLRFAKPRADFIWASPPCQGRTAYKRRPNHVRPVDTDGTIARVRELLRATGIPYVIENVPGAPLENPFTLCGSMFGLDVRRHRIFEVSFPVLAPSCNHAAQAPRFAPATNRTNLRRTVEVGVWRIPLEVQQRAMGIDWMTREELSQAIPPAYSEWIGREALKHIESRRAA